MRKKILTLFLACASATAFAQNQAEQSYDEFKLAMLQEYEEFRMQCNIEYAEFMKQAWKTYGAKPPVPAPKEEKQIVVRDFFGEEKMRTASIDVKPLPPLQEEAQPKPISKISEIEPEYVKPMSVKLDNMIGTASFRSLLPDLKVSEENGVIRFFRKVGRKMKNAISDASNAVKNSKSNKAANNKVQAKDKKQVQEQEKTETVVPEAEEEEIDPAYEDVNFTYFGTNLKVRMLEGFKFRLPDLKEQTLSDTWKLLSTPRFNNTIRDFLVIRYERNLCDWAYIEMLYEMAQEYFGKGTNEAMFFTGYMYCQSGYMMRLGKTDDKLYLLFASKHFIYDHLFYHMDGNDFFLLGNEQIYNLQICDSKYMKEGAMSLFVQSGVSLDPDWSDTRRFKSTKYSDFVFDVKVNKNLINFYNQYPTSMIDGNFMTRWATYANTPLDPSVKEQIYPVIAKHLKGMSQPEAINHLLSMLQTGFEYKLDNEVWGHDRAFFAEETLFYEGCDCEDKSILFSRIVRDILDMKVLLVYFPGHLLTAVHFDKDVEGLYCTYEGEKYVFCDPTFRGASFGRIYPEYVNEQPTVIELSKESKSES